MSKSKERLKIGVQICSDTAFNYINVLLKGKNNNQVNRKGVLAPTEGIIIT